MLMLKRFGKLLLVLISLSLILTGCWGKRELNDIGIVTITGIDTGPDSKIRVTVISVEPSGTSNALQKPPVNAWIGTAEGTSLVDAMKNLRAYSSRDLMWFQNRVVVIGEDMAKKGVASILDTLSRDREVRFNSYFFVTKGKASDLLQTPADTEENLSGHLDGLIKNSKKWDKACLTDLKDIMMSLAGEGKAMVMGCLSNIQVSRNIISTNAREYLSAGSGEKKINTILFEGSSIFKGDKLLCWLDGKETRGLNWIKSKANNALVTAEGQGDIKGSISFEARKAETKISPEIKNGKLTIRIESKVKGSLREQTEDNNIQNSEVLYKMENLFSNVIADEMKAVVEKMQRESSSDIFGFGDAVYRKYPKDWSELKNKWNDIFYGLKVIYDVKVEIKRFGEIPGTMTSEETE